MEKMNYVVIDTPENVMKFIDYLVRMQRRYGELYLVGEYYEDDNVHYENYSMMSHAQAASWIWHYALSREHGTELSFLTENNETIANIKVWDNVTTLEIPDEKWDDYDWRL